MTLKTLMLSAATGALIMSPALAQDNQNTSATEEVTVPLEGEVTIEVEVTDVQTSTGGGDETSAETSDPDATGDEGTADSGDDAASSDMGDDGVAREGGQGLSVATDGTDGTISEGGSDEGTGVSEEAWTNTEGDMQSEEGLTAAEGQQSDMGESEAQSEDDAMAGDGSAAGDAGGDQADTPDYGRLAGMTVGDLTGMEVQTPHQRRVGDIDYLIVRDGGIAAIVGVGGFLGLGEHSVALPLEEFQLVAEGDRLHVEFTEDELRAMSQIDESDLEGLDEDRTIEEIASGL